MANLATVGDSVAGVCTHVQLAYPNPTESFNVIGTLLTGSPTCLAGGKVLAYASSAYTFPHATCAGIGSTNSFHVNDLSTPDLWADGIPVARVGDATTHCGGPGSITGPGVSTAFN